MKLNKKQSSSVSQCRVSSTAKKSQSSNQHQKNIVNLGQYRQLGPKIHTSTGQPLFVLDKCPMSIPYFGYINRVNSPSNQQNNKSNMNNDQKQSEQHNKNTCNQKCNGSDKKILSQNYMNTNNIPYTTSQNYLNSAKEIINKNTLNVNNYHNLNQKKNSIKSPKNITYRNSGTLVDKQCSQQTEQTQMSKEYNIQKNRMIQNLNHKQNHNISQTSNIRQIYNKSNSNSPSNSLKYEQYLDGNDSVEMFDKLGKIEKGQNIQKLKAQLRMIFHFYTTFGDRQNITYLKSNKFYKMMEDAHIVSNTLTLNKLDILFCQASKHSYQMTFEVFLDLLPKVAIIQYPNIPAEEAILQLIINKLTPLFANIMESTELGREIKSFSAPLQIDCIELLTVLYPILQQIYESYFKWEPKNSMTKDQIYNTSLKELFRFLNEFKICPMYYTKSTAFLLYNYLVELQHLNLQFAVNENAQFIFGFKDYGDNFSFQRFLLFLVRSSIICYDNRIDSSKYICQSLIEKLNLLFETMEVSEGFQNIQRKTHITNNSHTSLLIPSAIIQKFSLSKSIEWNTPRTMQFSNNVSKIHSAKQSVHQISIYDPPESENLVLNNQNLRKSCLVEKLCQSLITVNVFEKYNDILLKIFKNYCSYGNPLNQTTLKTIKLIRLLKDAGIMEHVIQLTTKQIKYLFSRQIIFLDQFRKIENYFFNKYFQKQQLFILPLSYLSYFKKRNRVVKARIALSIQVNLKEA